MHAETIAMTIIMFLLIMLVAVFGSELGNQKFELQCKHYSVSSPQILREVGKARSATECALHCSVNTKCRSFTYRKHISNCLLAGKVSSCAGMVQEEGARHYQELASYTDRKCNYDIMNWLSDRELQGIVGYNGSHGIQLDWLVGGDQLSAISQMRCPGARFLRDCSCGDGYYGHTCSIKCATGFINLPNTTSCYRLMSAAKRWSQARDSCRALGADLSCPQTMQELNAVRQYIRSAYNQHTWIGVSDAGSENTWVCAATGQVIAVASGKGTAGPLFHPAEPNNVGGEQDCAAAFTSRDFFLGDGTCSNAYGYLCEKDAE